MSSLAFDTHKAAAALKQAGFDGVQAAAITEYHQLSENFLSKSFFTPR